MSKKHYIIVGGSRGLGGLLAKSLLKDGHRISILSRHAPSIATDSSIEHISVDLRCSQELLDILSSKLTESWDGLVFSQRYRPDNKNGASHMDEWCVAVDSCREILDYLGKTANTNAAVVVVGSEASQLIVRDQKISYHTTKGALEQLVRYYAVAFGGCGIRINMVAPCAFEKETAWEDEKRTRYAKLNPLRTIVTDRDVISSIKFLLSSEARCITGQSIILDAGMSIQSAEYIAQKLNLEQ
jgi:NAD(P)-dependent dehydrogenase (short-subunit alcohol dehydrogenase family)